MKNELYHHGIKGQKWGVRRYRNEDGSLTDAGKKRLKNQYDYKNSDAYKNLSEEDKYNWDSAYRSNKNKYGNKAANRIEYARNEGGYRNAINAELAEQKRANMKIAASGAAILALGIAGGYMRNKSGIDVQEKLISAKNLTNDMLKKSGKTTISVLKSTGAAAGTVAVKAGKKIGKGLSESAGRAGQAMVDAAMVSIGGIAVSKISEKYKPTDNDSEQIKNRKKLIVDTATAGINAATKTNSYSKSHSGSGSSSGLDITKVIDKPSNANIDRNSKEYANLFKNPDGSNRSKEMNAYIKSMSHKGYDIDQLQKFLNAVDRGEIKLQHGLIFHKRGDNTDMNELYHYGIKGMKWGVRRKYRDFAGSYTQAGVKRFDSAVDKYDEKKKAYDSVKKDKTVSKYDKNMIKAKMKMAKADVNKHYKHLKQDKLGDKGKLRYANGERIRGNAGIANMMSSIGGVALTSAAYMRANRIGSTKTQKYLAIAGAASIGAASVKRAIDYVPNNQLRAYYAHTSNY